MGRVESVMRRSIGIAAVLVWGAVGQAQWRHFGDSPAAPTAPSAASQMLAAHNAIRTRVGVPALRWSDSLASYAQQWAVKLAASGKLEHHSHSRYGENLFMISGDQPSATPSQVVSDWASEARDYDYSTNSCRRVCGHYTQIGWRQTEEVGWGVGRGHRDEVWVCEYNPPGNVIGQRPY